MLAQIADVSFFSTVTFGILSMLIVGASWCLIGFIMGDAPKKGIEPSLVQCTGAVFSCVASIAIMIATHDFPHCSWQITLFATGVIALGGFLNFFMLQLMSFAMQRGPNGVIWSIIQSALIFPFLGGVVFFGVELTWLRGGGIIAILIALAFFALTKDNSNQGKGWRLPAFIAFLLVGIQQNLTTMPSYFEEAKAVSSIVRTLAGSVGALLGVLVWEVWHMTPEYKQRLIKGAKNPLLWKYTIALQFFNLLFAYLLFYPGMNVMADHGLGGMCYPMMVGSCIVSFTITTALVLKEKITTLQGFGLICCICGLVLICTPGTRAESQETDKPVVTHTAEYEEEQLLLQKPSLPDQTK